MSATSRSLPWWDRTALLLALSGLVALSWALLIGMADTVMDAQMGIEPWSVSVMAMMLGMWVVMMVGMMVPTAVRSVLIFTKISAKAAHLGRAYVAGYWFVFGYIAIWSSFAVAATLLQWILTQLALLSPMMVASSSALGALLLVSAGVWQFSPWKDTCLKHCQSPLMFLAANYSPGVGGAVKLGIRHGQYCLGCCWLLMALLFVGGVMNLIWIAAITAFVLVEKLLPAGNKWGQFGGGAMILAGIYFLILA